MTEINNSGRLAVSVDKFNQHASGENKRHEATVITLDSPITIDGYSADNVKSAINKLNSYIGTVAVAPYTDATSSVKGIIKLRGDLAGTASTPIVTNITGSSGTSSIGLDQVNLYFTNVTGAAHKIGFQSFNPSGTAGTLKIEGQAARSSFLSTVHGGDITVVGGTKNPLGGTSRNGKVFIKTQRSDVIVVKDPGASTTILSLFGDVSTTDYPTAIDKTVYFTDALSDPSTTLLNGSVLYSRSGSMRVKHGNGDNFIIGDHPQSWTANVSTNLDITSGAYFDAKKALSGASEEIISSYTFGQNDGVILVEVELVGITTTPTPGFAGYKMTRSFKISGGTISALAAANFISTDESGDATSWTSPDIVSITSYRIDVNTGFSPSAHAIDWFATVKYIAIESA